MSRTETQAFFETYRDTFNRLDGDAVANLWHSSSGISDSGGEDGQARLTWWSEDPPMRANHRALCDVYRHNGFQRADFELLAQVPMGPNHAFAQVHWTLKRHDGSLLQQFHTGYHLMRSVQGPQVLLAVAYQEDISRMKPHAAE